jgi:hypothetical protein
VQHAGADDGGRHRHEPGDQVPGVLHAAPDPHRTVQAGPFDELGEVGVVERREVDAQDGGVQLVLRPLLDGGTSAPSTAATEASRSPRAAAAATTVAIAGSAATSRCGVGPAASSCVNTSAVASSPNAVTAPAATCTAPASRVSRGEARQAQRTASAAVPGAVAATARTPAFAVAA